MRDNSPAGSLLQYPSANVQNNVRDDTSDEPVRDRIRKRHDHDSNEGGNPISRIRPIDLGGSLQHHTSNKNERASGGPRGDTGKDRGEEDGDEEAETSHHCCDAGQATFGDSRAGFDVGGDWRGTEEGTEGDSEGIDYVGYGGALEVFGKRGGELVGYFVV